MKTLVVYTSQTGFTKKYATWLADRLEGDILKLDEAKKKNDDFFAGYDAICYGGWAMAGKVVDVKWFLDKADSWKNKRLAIFCVGASPENNPDVEKLLGELLNDEQKKYIKAFYCPGGLDYSKMKLSSRLAMKAFASLLKNKKDASVSEKEMAGWIDHSYDISDEKYINAIVDYISVMQ